MVTKPEMARPSGDEGTSPSVEGRPTSVKQGDTPAGNSDNEGSERPVREKLKNTTITAPPAQTTDADQPMTEPQAPTKDAQSESPNDSDGERRGRNRRKRSFDDIGEENKDLKVDKPSRKRSRDSNVVDKPGIQRRKTSGEKDEATAESNGADKKSRTPSSSGNSDRKPLMSPKGKRNREEFEDEDSKVSVIPPEEEIKAKVTKDEQPKLKKHRESNSPEAEPSKESEPQKTESKIPKTSGFSNTSTTSLFAALAASKSSSSSPQPQTSDSAFKASGFGALATSSTSGFGALGSTAKPTASVFGGAASPAKPSITGLSGGTTSSFGGVSSDGKSSFGSTAPPASAFGALGGGPKLSGFGGGSGPKLTSFGGGNGPKIVGLSEKPKAFGAPGEGDDDAGSEDEGSGDKDKALNVAEEEPKDERFFEQDVETGEENEETVFNCRAKLYNFVTVTDDKKEWKERGTGNLKLNVWKLSRADQEAKVPKKARFVMRADGSHRVVLNSPIQKELKFGGVPNGTKPTNGYVFFMGTMEGNGIELLQLKMKQANAEALWDHVSELQQEM
ncbi:hypothetical protein IWZ01DRAFT_538514 [Phyllosticta capitalensis]